MVPLLSKLAPHDTISVFEQAVLARLTDARALRAGGRSFWALYTLGYVVEMHLKIAFFNLYGLREGDDIGEALRIARPWGRQLGVISDDGNLHDLVFWLRLVLAERAFLSRPLRQELANEITARVQQVAKHWRPALRYRGAVEAAEEEREVHAAVTWIVQNGRILWS